MTKRRISVILRLLVRERAQGCCEWRDNWHEHFVWNHDYTLIIGLTPIGRATIVALRLNRDGVINLRRLLLLTGKHPPTLHSQV